jgi:hypothetical protein
MIFRGRIELQEQSRHAAHTSAITHNVETKSWHQLGLKPEMDRGQRWIVAWEALEPEIDDKRLISSGDGSQDGLDHDPIWTDNRRWMTRGGCQEMDHGRRMTINLHSFHEDIEVM